MREVEGGRERIPWLRRHGVHRLISCIGLAKLADLLYTYFIGGSLTRQDQITFARLHGIEHRAHQLTFINALACGIPLAFGYFLLGEGFLILSEVGSYAALPALFGRHVSLTMATISLAVDLFRAADALINHRCWAPFGLTPFIINLPTYINRLVEKLRSKRMAVTVDNDRKKTFLL
jgi:hypothetical protein